jgi:hypothetical protein
MISLNHHYIPHNYASEIMSTLPFSRQMNFVAHSSWVIVHITAKCYTCGRKMALCIRHRISWKEHPTSYLQKKRATCPHDIKLKWLGHYYVFLQTRGKTVLTTDSRVVAQDFTLVGRRQLISLMVFNKMPIFLCSLNYLMTLYQLLRA